MNSNEPSTRPAGLSRAIKIALVALVVVAVALYFLGRDKDEPGSDEVTYVADTERQSPCAFPRTGDSPWVGDDTIETPTTADGLVEIIVNLEDDRDDAEASLEAAFGIDLRLNSEHADDANLFLTRVPASGAAALAEDLSDEDGVEYAEVNGGVETFGVQPNDPLYMYQWNFDQVHAEGAWDHATGAGVVVAVIDTGVAYEDASKDRKRGIRMPDLEETDMVRGYDFVDDDEAPWDQHGHGTHVAGTVAQTTDNDYGVAGLAFDAGIMPLRVLDGAGRGNFADVADSIRYATDNGADVLNLSLGSFVPSREVESAIRYAHENGVVVVAAAGNSGTRIKSYPAAFDHVIAVAATQYDEKTTFYSNYGSYIDVAAPGGNTRVDQNKDGRPDGILQETLKRGVDGKPVMKPSFALYMGTSMAAPHVAAAAAMLVEQGVSHPDEVERLLKSSARQPGGGDEWNERHGAGIIDVEAALEKHTLDSGLFRVGAALIFALLAIFGIRRTGAGEPGDRLRGSFWAGWTLGAGALFALPLAFGEAGVLGGVFELVGRPTMTWSTVLLCPGDTNMFFASALPVLMLGGLLLGMRRGRHFVSGFGLATGAVLMVEAARQTIDVGWVPGIGTLDQAWLLANGIAAAVIGYVALRRA